MKKVYSLIFAALVGLFASAQNGYLILSSPLVQVEYQVTAMSPNGRWACGNINDGNYRGFIWDLVSGEVTELSATGDISIALDVSNDGVVVGSFTTTEGTPNNSPIETMGKWEDGKWTEMTLTTVDGQTIERDGYANAISADGSTIGGIAKIGNSYVPVVWNNGKAQIVDDVTGAVYDVSSDGNILCGWTTHPTKGNRTCAIWIKEADGKYTDKIHPDINSQYSAGPFVVARGISPNSKYVSAFRRLYNIEERKAKLLNVSNDQEFEASGVTNDGTVYGYIGEAFGSRDAVMLKADGTIVKLTDMFAQEGVDMSNYPMLINVISVSEDCKSFALIAYDQQQIPRSIVVKLGVNNVNPAPVALKPRVLEGINAVALNWNAPLLNAQAVKGYNVYRNGEKVNQSVLKDTKYVDQSLALGEYEYAVSAVYESTESEVSEPALVNISKKVSAPRNFFTAQVGINNARLVWSNPLSSLPLYRYHQPVMGVNGLGGGEFSFEGAIKLGAEELELYRKGGYKISEVSFYPMSEQAGWTLCFYYDGETEPFYEQAVDTKSLVYGVENRILLTTPVEIPEDVDVLVSVKVDTDGFGGYSVLGITPARPIAGYSDLIRQEGQDEFISMYESGRSSTSGAYEFNMSWMIGVTLKGNTETNELKEYVITNDAKELARTTDTKLFVDNLSDATYQYSVKACYADGTMSEPVVSVLNIKRNENAFSTILPEVTTKGAQMTATWDAPAENDDQWITYSSNTCTGGMVGAEADQFSYMAAVKFDSEKLHTLGGYQITAFKFYPLSDADFTFILKKGSEELVYLPLERGVDYKLNTWNTVYLKEPIKIEPTGSYYLILDCYDVTPETAPLGLDNQVSYPSKSDIYSVDDGETFLSLTSQGGKNANWMMGMVAQSSEPRALAVDGYNVYLNGVLHNATPISGNQYTIGNMLEGTYQLRVNPIYPGDMGEKTSPNVTFVIDLTSGIHNVDGASFEIKQGEQYVQVLGEKVKSLTLCDIQGKLLSTSHTNEVKIANLPKGVYLLKVDLLGKTLTYKLYIK